tara:strand:+ start:61 stop:837 length:777 start_codon:yes stop_codon:yes gene_type:complete
MFECSNCKRKLEDGTNFCPKCGVKQDVSDKCPICLENKKLSTLLCGHNICITCMHTCHKNKNECPICRMEIEKCPECYNFRVVKLPNGKKKCLDCKSIIKSNIVLEPGQKIICVDCNSRRVLFNPMDNTYNCSDCFCKFNCNLTEVIETIPKTRICMVCFSNQIEFIDNPLVESRFENYVDRNRCKNCEKKNVETKIISLEDYSKLRIKTKKEVNPDKVKICPECESKDIYSIETTVNQRFSCNNCSKQYFIPKIVEC